MGKTVDKQKSRKTGTAKESVRTKPPRANIPQREDESAPIQSRLFDCTDPKEDWRALAHKEDILRSIFESAPVGIGIVKNRVLHWINQHVSRMTGYSPEELRGRSARILYPSDEEFDRVGRYKYAEILSTGTGSVTTVWRRKDGESINVILSSTPVEPGNLFAGVVFTALDITEKQKSQEQLRKSEENYRNLFENAVMGIFQSSPEGRFLSVNPATARMCGYDSPEQMVADITDIATQHYPDPSEREFFKREVEEKGFVRNFEHRTFRRDGSIFWVSVNARVVRNRSGKILYYEGTHEDIQGRKEAEEALRQSEERFSKAFQSNPAPVAISSIDEGRYIDANDRFLEMFGYSREDVIGRTSKELGVWIDLSVRNRLIRDLREKGYVRNAPVLRRNKSGKTLTTLWSAEVVRLGDRDVLLTLHQDITERKNAEEKYQSILAEIEEFYYETDLRGNLTFFNDAACNIIGYAREELQGKNNREYTTPESSERMNRIFKSVYSTGEKKEITDYEVIRKDGSRRVLEISATLKRDERGIPNGFRGLGRDVTDRVKAEEALRLSEERYRAIFENSLVGIFQSTPEGRYISVNSAFARMYGYDSPKEVISSIHNIGSQIFVDVEERKRGLRILDEKGILERFEARTRSKDGNIMWNAINSRIVRDVEGQPLFIEGVIEDITEQKRAAEELKESQRLLADIISFLPDATLVIDREGRVIAWNRAMETMTGVSAADMVGKGNYEYSIPFYGKQRPILIDLALKPDQEFERRKYSSTERQESILTGEAYMPALRGGVAYLQGTASVLRDSAGNIIGAIESIRDITERRHMEETLKQSEERFSKAFQSSPAALSIATIEDGRILDANERLSDLFGYSRVDMIGRSAGELRLWDKPADRDRMIAELRNSGFVRNAPARFRNCNGDLREVLWSGEAIRLGEKEVLLSLLHDITDQKAAQDALKKSEERYRLLFNTISDAVFVHGLSADGKPDRFLEVNDVACQRLGYTREELLQMSPIDIDAPEGWALVPAAMQRLQAEKRAVWEGVHVSKDGTRIPVEIYNRLFDLEGTPTILSTVRDLTDRRRAEQEKARLEQQLRQAQKIEAVGTLAGGIAHDFNNILFAIIGYTEICLQDATDEETRWNLSQILTACSRAKNLVNQILAFSRQHEQERKPLDIVPLAKEVVKFLRSSLPSTIDLRLDAASRASTVLADATRIHQVIMNLCTNAAHAMRASGGRLWIVIDNAAPPSPEIISGEEHDTLPGGYVHLSVRDTGHGVEPANLNRIFDPFYTTKAPGEGTGLGLSVVYGIVKNFGGSIHVESTPGRGSTFDVYFPAVAAAQEEPATDATLLPRGTERILFVDDESLLIDIMGHMLSALGYRTTTVRESAKALEMFLGNPDAFDLVITDMTMPDMTGVELAHEILRFRPETPIILVTGYSDLITEKEALKMGIRRFLMKPLFLGDVAREVRAAIDKPQERVPN